MTDADVVLALAINWLARCAQDGRPLTGEERLEIQKVIDVARRTVSAGAKATGVIHQRDGHIEVWDPTPIAKVA